MDGCLFCKIVAGQAPADRVLDEPDVVGFLDTRPVFPGHVLLVPRQHFVTLMDLPTELLTPLFDAAQRVGRALEAGLDADGVFMGINNRISQSVAHLHVHAVPRRRKDGLRGFFWPRTKYASDEESAAIVARHRQRAAGLNVAGHPVLRSSTLGTLRCSLSNAGHGPPGPRARSATPRRHLRPPDAPDVGAGDGFTVTPAKDEISARLFRWSPPRNAAARPAPAVGGGEAEALPFATDAFDAAYATWAYFFTRDWDPSPGLRGYAGSSRPAGPLVIVDNLGGDEFTALAASDISADPSAWRTYGFATQVIDTVFEFETASDAARLFELYFGDRAPDNPKLTWTYRVGVVVGTS